MYFHRIPCARIRTLQQCNSSRRDTCRPTKGNLDQQGRAGLYVNDSQPLTKDGVQCCTQVLALKMRGCPLNERYGDNSTGTAARLPARASAVGNLQTRFKSMLAEYERITGFRETNPNAVFSPSPFGLWAAVSALREAVENTASEGLRFVHEARVVLMSEMGIFRQSSL